MIELDPVNDLCQRLAMGTMATHLGHLAEEAVRKEWSYQACLEENAPGGVPRATRAQPSSANKNGGLSGNQNA